ncbi:glycosyltransferase [Chamaesiphon sp. GL140_3_metabinner_50]|uniref:glycosyltransferase n=1 Tax=Chamaesiphon sp. GL140_3_metabinner_50 TaxID=2970812 RepID=UPI0025E2CC6F|nr:glycosyltransferase [Chamaesiphon sp. GL140_3_metabinner_50]
MTVFSEKDRMTDIAFLLVDLGGGGAEKVMLSLAGGFAEKGLKVDLVLVKLGGDYQSIVSPKVRVINLSHPRLITSLPLLVNYLKQHRPKVLISALEDANTVAILAKILARTATRVIVSVHNPLAFVHAKRSALKQKLTPLFIRWLFPFADAIVGVSQGVCDNIALVSGLPRDRINVIYNPIFTPELLKKFDEPVNEEWFLDRQTSVILAVGRLSKEKDFPSLIRAFALVKQQYPVKLIILGQGGELLALEQLVKELKLVDDVAFPGFVTNPYAYMSKAKMLVMTSIYEGFGNVLVEAAIAGTPVVSTNCESGPAEILEDGKYGDLVAVGDVPGLAAAIISTLKNPRNPDLLKQRGQEFSLEAALKKYQLLFNFN